MSSTEYMVINFIENLLQKGVFFVCFYSCMKLVSDLLRLPWSFRGNVPVSLKVQCNDRRAHRLKTEYSSLISTWKSIISYFSLNLWKLTSWWYGSYLTAVRYVCHNLCHKNTLHDKNKEKNHKTPKSSIQEITTWQALQEKGGRDIPLTIKSAAAETVSTSVCTIHTYFPECFNWMFLTIRSPANP